METAAQEDSVVAVMETAPQEDSIVAVATELCLESNLYNAQRMTNGSQQALVQKHVGYYFHAKLKN